MHHTDPKTITVRTVDLNLGNPELEIRINEVLELRFTAKLTDYNSGRMSFPKCKDFAIKYISSHYDPFAIGERISQIGPDAYVKRIQERRELLETVWLKALMELDEVLEEVEDIPVAFPVIEVPVEGGPDEEPRMMRFAPQFKQFVIWQTLWRRSHQIDHHAVIVMFCVIRELDETVREALLSPRLVTLFNHLEASFEYLSRSVVGGCKPGRFTLVVYELQQQLRSTLWNSGKLRAARYDEIA